MSVLSQRSVICFRAPITASNTLVSMTGSWEKCAQWSLHEYRTSPLLLSHIRLATWKHQMKHSIVDTCLDWTVQRTQNGLYFSVDIAFTTPFSVQLSDFEGINNKVQIILNQNQFILQAQTLFQQTHPGDGAASVIAGSTGNDGASQSV